ncbi:MAG: inositol monophosphatase [Clostridiales bacterium]|nr:inositol monophosphatase [Clostridiales bacterium]
MTDFDRVVEVLHGVRNIVLDPALSSRVTVKNPADYVTGTDYAVQEYLRVALAGIYPGAALVSEENPQNNYGSRAVWILDPIDGTTNLIHGYGKSAVSLALVADGEGVFGAVYNPFSDEMFTARRGGGAYLNGRPIHCAERRSLSECLANTETSPYYKESSEVSFEILRRLFLRCQDIRVLGSAALGLAYVAAGRADLFMSRNLKPWDHAATGIIIKEAGGCISDFSGRPLGYEGVECVIAGAPGIWDELREFAAEFKSKTEWSENVY